MEENQNIPTNPNFSDIPALGDEKGLENYLNTETLKAQGVSVETPAPAAQQTPASTEPAAQPAAQPVATAQDGSVTLTKEQFDALVKGRAVQQQPAPAPQAKPAGYTQQEQAFIQNALAKGYTLEQINNFLTTQKRTPAVDPAMAQRLANVEKYLRDQEVKAAETAFINKMTSFGEKWGLSEQDLVTFGNTALQHGINIAQGNVDLEMVFRAVFPEQYSIRSRRMTPTNSSQIYGGTSVPEGNRVSASKLEDAYVEQFLKGAMPNQYGMLNKK